MIAWLRRVLSPPTHDVAVSSADQVLQDRSFGNSAWLIADKLIQIGFSFAVGIWVARYLGPSQFGELSFALAFASLFGVVAVLGLNQIVVRDLVKLPHMIGATMGTATLLRLGGGVLSVALAEAGIFILRPDDTQMHLLVLIVACIAIFQSSDGIDYWFQSQVRAGKPVVAKTLSQIGASGIRVILILVGASVVGFAWAHLAEAALLALALAAAYGYTESGFKTWSVSTARARELLRDSWPLIISSLVVILYMRIDQVMLGQMTTTEEVGIYSVAVRLSEVTYLIPSSIVSTWLPSIISAHTANEALFQHRLQRLYNLMALLGYAVAIPTIFIAGPMIRILFGQQYSRAAPMLVVLTFATIFINLGIARSTFLTAVNWPRTHLVTVSLGAIVNIGLNLWLIPRYGGLGAAWASLVAYWIAAHGSSLVLPHLRRQGTMLTRAMILPKWW